MRGACLNVIRKISAICNYHGTAVIQDLNFIVSLGGNHHLFLAAHLQSSVIWKAIIIINWGGVSEDNKRRKDPYKGSPLSCLCLVCLSPLSLPLWAVELGGLSAVSLSLQAHTVPSALLMVRSHGVLPKQALRGAITYLLIWLWSYTYY